MAESVVSFVVKRLGDLLINEAKFLSSVAAQVKQIQAELKRMKCFLKDADARQDEDETVRNWVAEIREIALDVQDVLETYAFRVSSRKDEGILRRYGGILKKPIVLYKIGSDIEAIKTKISDLTASLQTYGIKCIREGEGSSSASEKQLWLRRSYAHVVDEDFVGLEGDVEKLVGRLVNEDKDNCYRVVCIHGMGGLGKTTLARKVYHHDNVRKHFDALAWVCISQQWQPTDVLQGILTKLIPRERENIMSMRGDELVKELYEVQQERKCLVVLDDVWSVDVWNILKDAFPNTQMGSKILVTTRIREVALHMDPNCFLHKPRCLDEEESWELFQKKAFPSQKGCGVDPEMSKLGREMLGYCGGLPLAIVAFGGILRRKCTLGEWKMVHQTFHSYLRGSKIQGEQYGSVNELLALSYHHLPYQFKPCFLYLGNFAEDSLIRTQKLYKLWAAEGFLPLVSNEGEEEETIMNVGECYLDELVQRSMVQLRGKTSSGRFKFCQLHDLMRDLCLSKGKEEFFSKILPLQRGNQPVDSTSPFMTTGSIRRFSVHGDFDFEKYFPPEEKTTKHIRSLLFVYGNHQLASLNSICNDFKLLRVLDLEGYSVVEYEVPKAIGNLFHLRYLSFRDSYMIKLSVAIRNLRNLQTLDLRSRRLISPTKPDVLQKMERLRHLYLPSYFNVDKLLIGNLSKLEILENFDTRIYDFSDLFKLKNLRKLSADLSSLGFKDLAATIKHLAITSNRLRKSSLRIKYNFHSEEEVFVLRQLLGCHHLCKLDLNGKINKLPEYRHISQILTELTLSGSELEEDPMATLENLPKLVSLTLSFDAYIGKEMVCSSQGFRQLKTLHLWGLHSLENWMADEGAMPNLHHLEIEGCEKLEIIPNGLKLLPTYWLT